MTSVDVSSTAEPRSSVEELLRRAAEMAGTYLSANADRDVPVVRFLPPDELRAALTLALPTEGRPLDSLLEDMRQVLHHSVRTGHPRFLNQLFGGYDPAAILGEWIVALINTSMYTYEVAPVATLMEVELARRMSEIVGFDDGEGVFAPGGSVSNLMGVLMARHHTFPHVKKEGLKPEDRPAMFVSTESHYSLERAAGIAGFGMDSVIKVATDGDGRMRGEALESAVRRARASGRRPFLVAATSGTTVPGAFDPLAEIADVAGRHGLWMHVDAAYGGTVLFSKKHRWLVDGISRADSIAWNPHKMMGVPLSCSATLVRRKGSLEATHGMHADYLFHDDIAQRQDLGDLTVQCGRRVDALKLWFSWQALGDAGYEARVDHLFRLARAFRGRIVERPGFRLVREPQSANVCFRYLPPDRVAAARLAAESEATVHIRNRLLADGRFMINYAPLDGGAAFRLVLSNPNTTLTDLEELLDAIEAAA
jgi:glutamate/tyrosine decarboxylase-like PLP-dependent enzyme